MKAQVTLSLATTLFVSTAFAQNTISARPGTINYVEGQATLNGQPLASSAAGHTEIAQGQSLATTTGKVEVLLTPGVFLRLGDNSAITMVSPDLTKTEVQVDRGRAEFEVDQIYKQNDLLVDQGPAQAKLLDHGLYEFDATAGTMQVYDGKAAVSPAQNAEKWITVKGGHVLALNGTETKSEGFNRDDAAKQDPLYAWSSLRAEYLGKSNQALAQEYAGSDYGYSGWSWNPAVYSYTWLPASGLFWSPFGYGFYSPYYLYAGGPIYPGFGFGGGFYRGGYGYYGGGYGGYGGYYGGHAGYPYNGGRVYKGGGTPASSGYAGSSGFRGGSAPSAGYRSSGGGGGFHGGGGGGGSHGGGGRR